MNINDMEIYRRQIAKGRKDKAAKGASKPVEKRTDKPAEAEKSKAKKGGK